MDMKRRSMQLRWFYMAVAVLVLLFTGVNYTWSILKAPLAQAYHWMDSQLALNFTLAMSTFCLGGFLGGVLTGRFGGRRTLLLSAALCGLGYFLTSRITGRSLLALYLCYGILGGLGIGIAYNVIISTVSAWFPDKKGLCSGLLMMGFGISALLVGEAVSRLIEGPGWRTAFLAVSISLAVTLTLAALILRRPGPEDDLPAPETSTAVPTAVQGLDCTTGEMVRRLSFWKAFLCIAFLSAVGNAVVSFTRDLCLSAGASAALATALVGVFSVCNGVSRILTGALFDRIGRKATMRGAILLTVAAAGILLAASALRALPLCVLGICLAGFSYGSSPTITSVFTAAFYGTRHFPVNFPVMNFNLMLASFMATAANALLETSGGYVVPFAFLLALALLSLLLNSSIRKP